ncbi:MAG: hypothetical protein Q8N47_16725 [Bryobacterales bacterium]|nr:hypothetical protein [Bryobacterales bacterium]
MRIGGIRIQNAGTRAHRVEATQVRLRLGASGIGSADASQPDRFLPDAEPEPAAAAVLEASIMDGSYRIPAPEVSKSLVDGHVVAKP